VALVEFGAEVMFETISHRSGYANPKRSATTLTLTLLVHGAIIGVLLLVPMWFMKPVLPAPSGIAAFVIPQPSSPPPPPPPPAEHLPPAAEPKPAPVQPRIIQPTEIPALVQPEKPPEAPIGTAGVVGGVEGGVPGGTVFGIVGNVLQSGPTPPPDVPVRVGGQIKAPGLSKRVDPEYPPIARSSNLQGIVILEATVDTQGHVQEVKVLRSAGVFDEPAVSAVKQWQYSPLMLNGKPTPFVVTVTVKFGLTGTATGQSGVGGR
jgi:periplasmic protein TonB